MGDETENAAPEFNHVMVDIETMSTNHDAAVLSIGAVAFDPSTGKMGPEFHQKIEFNSAITNGHVSTDTLKWWISQESRAGKSVIEGTLVTADVLKNFSTWLEGTGAVMWGNGATFDITILETLYKRNEMTVPWKFYNVRDCRTIEDVSDGISSRRDYKREGIHHDALDDAKYQATYISGMWKMLRAAKTMQDAARIDPVIYDKSL